MITEYLDRLHPNLSGLEARVKEMSGELVAVIPRTQETPRVGWVVVWRRRSAGLEVVTHRVYPSKPIELDLGHYGIRTKQQLQTDLASRIEDFEAGGILGRMLVEHAFTPGPLPRPTDYTFGSWQFIGPWEAEDQPVRVRAEIQDGKPGLIFEWEDGRMRAIYLNPSSGGASADAFVYRGEIQDPGDPVVFSPDSDAPECFIPAV